jgi:hypothetical protein
MLRSLTGEKKSDFARRGLQDPGAEVDPAGVLVPLRDEAVNARAFDAPTDANNFEQDAPRFNGSRAQSSGLPREHIRRRIG